VAEQPAAVQVQQPLVGNGVDDAAVIACAAALGRHLEAAGGMVATAESCTGGLIARAFTETAGSSAWFDRGFVTYSNESKVDLIGVRLATLAAHGAVSEAVAREMAVGALKHSQAVMALSVTGVAGPGGGVPGKPVGLVCFGWALALPDAGRSDHVVVETWLLPGDRAAVRRRTAHLALARGLALLKAVRGE
jgi:nicotinamide-nucleotide amidase